MIGANERRPDDGDPWRDPWRDPWEDVAEAKAQRGAIVACWIAGARCRGRRRSQLASTPPWSASAGAVATRAMLPLAAVTSFPICCAT